MTHSVGLIYYANTEPEYILFNHAGFFFLFDGVSRHTNEYSMNPKSTSKREDIYMGL